MLIVEDGTGIANAESYLSVDDASAILLKYGTHTEWAIATDEQKEQALRVATLWLDNNFSWYSSLSDIDIALGTTTQALGWPRVGYYTIENRYVPNGIVPEKVKEATAMMASEHLKKDLMEDTVKIKSESIGPASVSYMGVGGKRTFTFLKLLLREYGTSGKSKSATVWRA